MSNPWLEVVSPGPLASIQDGGRKGLRRSGIPWAGVLAPAWQHIANALVGNPEDHPVIECFEGGLILQAHDADVLVGIAGDASLERIGANGEAHRQSSWQSCRLSAGDRLSVRASGQTRCVIVSVYGLDVRIHHGSASTYARAGLGGLDGSPLKSGDQLKALPAPKTPCRGLDARAADDALALMLPSDDALILHAVPGPQQDAFSEVELQRFFSTDWRVGAETDRMGTRLDGATIAHLDDQAKDIVSDAIVPGSVQVPGNGRPILMSADAATVGGYPKIATVASSDLAGIALARPGTAVRFVRCTTAQAVAHTREMTRTINALLSRIEDVVQTPDTAQLLNVNLIDGVVSADHA